MLSIEDTLSLHRTTRLHYMSVARIALADYKGFRPCYYKMSARHYVTGEILLVPRAVDSFQACRCFLRHARAANRKLVQVKRFSREFNRAISLGYEPNGDELDYLRAQERK